MSCECVYDHLDVGVEIQPHHNNLLRQESWSKAFPDLISSVPRTETQRIEGLFFYESVLLWLEFLQTIFTVFCLVNSTQRMELYTFLKKQCWELQPRTEAKKIMLSYQFMKGPFSIFGHGKFIVRNGAISVIHKHESEFWCLKCEISTQAEFSFICD